MTQISSTALTNTTTNLLDREATRARFPALVADPATVHADAPGGTQILDSALDAMRETAISANANQHALFAASNRVDALNDDARATFGRFLGTDPEGIVFGPNMTTLAFHLSHALDEVLATGGEIVCTRLDHDANVSPWLALAERTGATVRFVDITADGRIDQDSLEAMVTDRTRLITFPLASNSLGTVVDPAPFVAAARRVGALSIMDAVHAAPHVAIDREAMGIDVVLCSPYKFFGPHAGVLAADPALLERLAPDKVRPSPDEGPERWQTGTASFEAVAAAAAAVTYMLDEVGMTEITQHERELSAAFLSGMATRDSWTVHGPGTAHNRTPTFAVTHATATAVEIATYLAAHKVNVYEGYYYALEPMRALGLLEAGAVRIGFVHYHGVQDVERVLEVMDGLG